MIILENALADRAKEIDEMSEMVALNKKLAKLGYKVRLYQQYGDAQIETQILKQHEYYPDIYNVVSKNCEYKIASASYGALEPKDFAKFISQQQDALSAVELIKKAFPTVASLPKLVN